MLTLNQKEIKLIADTFDREGLSLAEAEYLGMSVEDVDKLMIKVDDAVKAEDTWLTRLKQETDELTEKLQKLLAFYETETYKNLEGFDKSMLHFQHCAMSSYHHALELRYLKASENV